jgi:hypothetical protein
MNRTTAPVREQPLRDEPPLPEPPADTPREIVLPPAVAPGRSLVPVRTRPVGSPEPGVAGAGAWIVGWGEIVLLGVLALVGAFFASANAAPGDYTCGMILLVAAIALAFLRLKARLDSASSGGASGGGASGGWAASLLVDDWANLTAVIVVFVILGLIGLFLAAGHEYGGLHSAGLALFVASGAAVFLNLKHVFDRSERGIGDRSPSNRGLSDRGG